MDVSNYFPAGGKGHILVTTRNPGAVVHATAGDFRFREMDPEEAITLLLKSAYPPNRPEHPDPNSRKLAQGIAVELGYLALALAHAGATIRRNIYTLERYLHYYLGHRKGMISLPHVKSADDANIITTWEIPFRRIVTRQSVEHKDAVDLMHIFAFMHFESISESIFQRSWNDLKGPNEKSVEYPGILRERPVWNEDAQARLRRAIRVLCDYSIIEHDPDKQVCSLHPVVHAWTRDRLSKPEQKRWLSCTAAVLARCISPELEPSGRAFRRLLIPHIDSCLRALGSQSPSFAETVERADELHRFASVYAENGLWKQARTLQRKVVSFRTKKLGRWHEDTIRAQRSLGYTYWNLADVKSAIELQSKVLKSRWWSRPSLVDWAVWPPWLPHHVSYCVALDDLTLTLWLAGRRDLSRKAGERAVKGLKRRLGPDDPMTLSAMFNLARTYVRRPETETLLRTGPPRHAHGAQRARHEPLCTKAHGRGRTPRRQRSTLAEKDLGRGARLHPVVRQRPLQGPLRPRPRSGSGHDARGHRSRRRAYAGRRTRRHVHDPVESRTSILPVREVDRSRIASLRFDGRDPVRPSRLVPCHGRIRSRPGPTGAPRKGGSELRHVAQPR